MIDPLAPAGESDPKPAITSQEALDRALASQLTESGRLTPDEHHEVVTEQLVSGGTLALHLWELGLVGADELSERCGQLLGLPVLRHADGRDATAAALDCLSRSFVRRAALLPIALEDRCLRLATAQPWRLDLLDEAAARAGRRVEPGFMCDVALMRLLHRHFEVVPPPRYRARPLSRSRPARAALPPAEGLDEPLPELTSEAEFLALYASDRIATPPPAETAEAPKPDLEDDEEELILSELVEEPGPAARSLRAIPSAAEAMRELEAARDRSELGSVLVRFGLSFAERVALFTCRRGVWLGWTGGGAGLDPRRLGELMVPVVDGTAFGLVQHGGAPLLGPLAPHPVHRAFCAAMGTREGSPVGLFPVHHRGRVLLVLYLDAGGAAMPQIAEVLILAQRIPSALERMASRAQSLGMQ